nr:PREDICTED: olfactory receptor 52D1-like [Lepisosteus oculatus]
MIKHNSSVPYYSVSVIFTSYGSLSSLHHLYFTLALVVYLITLVANIFLMVVIYMEPSLHKPMYIFLFNLALNGLYGSSAFYPQLLDNLLSEVQGSSYVGCLVQVFCMSSYATCAYAILTVMAYDRYVSICKPLLYYRIITNEKVKRLLMFSYFFPVLGTSINTVLTARLPLCELKIHRLFCDNWAVVKNSCINTNLNNVFGLLLIVIFVILPMFFVIFTYSKILMISLKTSKEAQRKALSTCAPHLITFINFSIAVLFALIYNRFDVQQVPAGVNIMISVHFVVIPPLLHPIIYGIRTQEIRKCIRKLLGKKASITQPGAHFKKASSITVPMC